MMKIIPCPARNKAGTNEQNLLTDVMHMQVLSHASSKKFELLYKHSSSLLSVKIHMTTFLSCSAHQLPFEVKSLPQGVFPAV